jgi:hypothetical protein
MSNHWKKRSYNAKMSNFQTGTFENASPHREPQPSICEPEVFKALQTDMLLVPREASGYFFELLLLAIF